MKYVFVFSITAAVSIFLADQSDLWEEFFIYASGCVVGIILTCKR